MSYEVIDIQGEIVIFYDGDAIATITPSQTNIEKQIQMTDEWIDEKREEKKRLVHTLVCTDELIKVLYEVKEELKRLKRSAK